MPVAMLLTFLLRSIYCDAKPINSIVSERNTQAQHPFGCVCACARRSAILRFLLDTRILKLTREKQQQREKCLNRNENKTSSEFSA